MTFSFFKLQESFFIACLKSKAAILWATAPSYCKAEGHAKEHCEAKRGVKFQVGEPHSMLSGHLSQQLMHRESLGLTLGRKEGTSLRRRGPPSGDTCHSVRVLSADDRGKGCLCTWSPHLLAAWLGATLGRHPRSGVA